MISKSIRAIFFTLAVSLSGIAATSATSQAGTLNVDFRISGPGFYFSSGRSTISRDHRRGYRDHRRGYRDYRFDRRSGYNRRVCTPRRALRKARRMGVRDARIARVNNRVIVVRGYKYRGYAKVKFARSTSCPVLAFRTR